MAKYLFNSNIMGYEFASAKEFNKEVTSNDLMIIILDKTCQPESSLYYKIVDEAIKNRCRVILIGVEDDNTIFDAVASNMIMYRNYDVYQVVNKDTISANYLVKLQERKPDLAEAQAFLSKETMAYNDICNILYGIESLVNEGNIDGLKNHVERHMMTIEGLVSTINKMKKTCDSFNSDELLESINNLKAQIESLNTAISDKDKSMDDIKHNRDEYKVEAENLKREVAKLKAAGVAAPAAAAEPTKSVIKTYTAYNTALHTNNKAIVIYFKEVSYVRFTNTMITMLMDRFEKTKVNCKLLIYDNSTSMVANYNLDVVTGEYYASNKAEVLKKKKKMVVTEPFQSIIQDVISSPDAADVVIVYDRLKQYEDIVKGNNVTKFFVINSKNDVKSTMGVKSLGADDTGYIITNASNTFKYDNESKQVQFLDIPIIGDNFSALTEAAKLNRYNRLRTTIGDVLLLDTIIKKSHIETR